SCEDAGPGRGAVAAGAQQHACGYGGGQTEQRSPASPPTDPCRRPCRTLLDHSGPSCLVSVARAESAAFKGGDCPSICRHRQRPFVVLASRNPGISATGTAWQLRRAPVGSAACGGLPRPFGWGVTGLALLVAGLCMPGADAGASALPSPVHGRPAVR